MSKAAMQWARALKIENAPMAAVLRALAYIHSEKHDLFPSQQYLADETGLSVRAVRYALQQLSHFKLITRTARSVGRKGRTSDKFELHLDRCFPVTRDMVMVAKKGLRKTQRNRQAVPVAGDNLQAAPRAGAPGITCLGIGDDQSPIHRGANLSVSTKGDTAADGARLKVIDGGRA